MKAFSSEIHRAFTEQIMSVPSNNFSEKDWQQFHWQILITNFGVWLVNILLQKFDTSSKKEMEMRKTIFLWKSTKKMPNKYTHTLSGILYSELASLICNINMLQTLEIRGKSTIINKIFETNSRFHVQWHTTGKIQFLFFGRFFLLPTKFSIRGED